MKTKKLWALIMALAMALSLAVPSFAENTATDDEQEVVVTGTTKTGAISITVAAAGAIVLNPYQMKATTTTDTVGSYHQIFSAPVSCKNKSNFGLKVNAVITGEKAGNAAFVTSAPKDTDTGNNVFLYAEFGVSDSATTEPTWETAFNAKTPSQVLVGETASTSKTVATLGATDGTDAGANYLWYKFDGAATKSPTTSWATGDTVKATIALTLVPTVDTVYPITLTNTTSKTAAGTAKLNYDLAPAGVTISVTCTPDTTLGGTPTVTAMQGTTKLTVEGDAPFTFEMPAGDVAVTVKWTAS